METIRGSVKGSRDNCNPLKRVGKAGLRILDRLVGQHNSAKGEDIWLHAYAIHKETKVTYPAVWAFLVGLEKAGLVETRRVRVGGRARKLYRLNEAGYKSAVDVFRRKAMGPAGSPDPTPGGSTPPSSRPSHNTEAPGTV